MLLHLSAASLRMGSTRLLLKTHVGKHRPCAGLLQQDRAALHGIGICPCCCADCGANLNKGMGCQPKGAIGSCLQGHCFNVLIKRKLIDDLCNAFEAVLECL